MINFLDLLGIHEYDIEVAEETITDELEYLGLNSEANDLAERTMQYLCEREITEDLGNTIIDCMLEAAAGIVEEKLGERLEMELCCNGAASSFMILDQDVREAMHFASSYDLDYNFVKWLRNTITEPKDFETVLEVEELRPALENLYNEGGSLVWSDRNEVELTDEEINQRSLDCEANPNDTSKIFFEGYSGKIWEYAEPISS